MRGAAEGRCTAHARPRGRASAPAAAGRPAGLRAAVQRVPRRRRGRRLQAQQHCAVSRDQKMLACRQGAIRAAAFWEKFLHSIESRSQVVSQQTPQLALALSRCSRHTASAAA